MRRFIEATVRFALHPGGVSGKTRGYASGVRPNHRIDGLSSSAIGQVTFPDGQIQLGEEKTAQISYIYWPELEEKLKPGLVYDVCEGARCVGKVTVISVAHDPEDETGYP